MKSIPLLDILRAHVEENHLQAEKVGVAFSGGLDSSVLLWATSQVLPSHQIYALHVDHGLRSEGERNQEKALAHRVATHLGVVFVSLGPPTDLSAMDQGVESFARDYRYGQLVSAAHRLGVFNIFLAHHADDQAETIFMRLMRGGSWDGLAGMPGSLERQGVVFRRPFLTVEKKEILAVAHDLDLEFWEDSTNAQTDFQRNFLRNELFPLIRSRFPRFQRALTDFGQMWERYYPRLERDSQWKCVDGQWQLPEDLWDGWEPQERVGQLLRLLDRSPPRQTVSRRFLSQVALSTKKTGQLGQGAGFQIQRKSGFVIWKDVAETSAMGYFVKTQAGVPFKVNCHPAVYTCTKESGDQVLFLPGIDYRKPLLWKNREPGERLFLGDGLSQKKERSEFKSPSLVYVYQGADLKAIVDLEQKKAVWTKVEDEKLQSFGIFVRFSQRSYS